MYIDIYKYIYTDSIEIERGTDYSKDCLLLSFFCFLILGLICSYFCFEYSVILLL